MRWCSGGAGRGCGEYGERVSDRDTGRAVAEVRYLAAVRGKKNVGIAPCSGGEWYFRVVFLRYISSHQDCRNCVYLPVYVGKVYTYLYF